MRFKNQLPFWWFGQLSPHPINISEVGISLTICNRVRRYSIRDGSIPLSGFSRSPANLLYTNIPGSPVLDDFCNRMDHAPSLAKSAVP